MQFSFFSLHNMSDINLGINKNASINLKCKLNTLRNNTNLTSLLKGL